MNEAWNSKYSTYYDLLYSDKDYNSETDFLEKIFRINGNPKKILELGCGTGNYTQILTMRGYDLTGLDISEGMIQYARRKCSARFLREDMRNFALEESFDACIAMFAVIGYLNSFDDVLQAFRSVRRHLKPRGLFTFDVWNGLAVLHNMPESRVKELESNELKIIRTATPKLRVFENICEVFYHVLIIDKKTHHLEETKERHIMRYFFPQELLHLLRESGFEVIKICTFMDLEKEPSVEDWNMTIVARAES